MKVLVTIILLSLSTVAFAGNDKVYEDFIKWGNSINNRSAGPCCNQCQPRCPQSYNNYDRPALPSDYYRQSDEFAREERELNRELMEFGRHSELIDAIRGY